MKTLRRPHVSPAVVARINRVEARHRGKIVAIEPVSGDYYIGATQIEALMKALRRHPQATFVFKRIGYRWTHRHAGPMRKVAR